jgi:hypothetical protein
MSTNCAPEQEARSEMTSRRGEGQKVLGQQHTRGAEDGS